MDAGDQNKTGFAPSGCKAGFVRDQSPAAIAKRIHARFL
jgi:hypothetical protein